jgi:hypothetical protein
MINQKDYKSLYYKYKKKYLILKKEQKGGSKTEVEEAWKLIIEYSMLGKKKYGDKFDGLEYWNNLKLFLKEIDNRFNSNIEWNPNHFRVIENFKSVIQLIPEKDINNNLIEKNHFLLQQLNIPNKDNGIPSFTRLMQIALNIGQLKSYQNPFTSDILKVINDNNLSNINTYMTSDNYNKYIFDKSDLLKLITILKKLEKTPPLIKHIESSNINISGPVSITYLSNDSKRVILIGDMHNNNFACKENDIEINNYINTLFDNKNIENFDLFIEAEWNHMNKLNQDENINFEVNDYISKIRKLGIEKYKININKRVHFNDVRDELNIDILAQIGKPLEELLNNVTSKDSNYNFDQVFFGFYGEFVQMILEITVNIQNYLNNDNMNFDLFSNLINKEIKQLKKEDLKKILNIFYEKSDSILKVLYSENYFMTLDKMNEHAFSILFIITALAELYTIARLMKPEFKNIIVYSGNQHSSILTEYLISLDFKIDYQDLSGLNEETLQCVNAIPFDNYFE